MSHRPIHILHVYRTYFPDSQGGLEEALRQICASTSRRGFEHRILTVSRHGREEPRVTFSEAEVFRAPQSFELASCNVSLRGPGLFRDLLEWADIVHYQFPWPFADFLHLFGQVKKPSLITYQSDIVRQKVLGRLYSPLMHRFLGSVNSIVATSENYASSSTVLQRYREKVVVIPNCLDESLYPEPSLSRQSSWQEKLPEKFFLFVGVLRYYKGLHVLLEAMQGLPFACVIAGKGPLERELKSQAEKLKLDNVIFTGYIDDEDKAVLFTLCEGVVFPSHLRSEAFGITLLEGAMYGKPLISTELGTGTSYVNRDGETGILVQPGNVTDLAKAMLFIHENPEQADLMGKNARQRYQELFSPERVGSAYASLYHSLVNDTQGRA